MGFRPHIPGSHPCLRFHPHQSGVLSPPKVSSSPSMVHDHTFAATWRVVSWYNLPSFLSCLCLFPTPSPSPSTPIQPHLPAFHHLHSNSEVYLCNYTASMLRLASD